MTTGMATGGPINACQTAEIEFTPQIPTVMILVDRSSSMWENMFWDPFRDGVLEVVQSLQADVRFGFATYTGQPAQTCPIDLQTLGTIDLNNHQAIADFWNPIVHPGAATETPTAAGVIEATALLQADATTYPGPKFILLVTDGNPDYCDNGDAKCRADTLVLQLQKAHTAGIKTFVVALPDPSINQGWLTAFANAGDGQAVQMVEDTQFCQNAAIPTESAPLFPEPFPQGTYMAAMGPATPFSVDPAEREELVSTLGGLVAGVKSCEFDLTDTLQINTERAGEGQVSIEGTSLTGEITNELQPYDPTGTNGWTVSADGTQVILVGSSCDKLRSTDTSGIHFGFPCDIIVEIPK
jgi:hypothetical protein